MLLMRELSVGLAVDMSTQLSFSSHNSFRFPFLSNGCVRLVIHQQYPRDCLEQGCFCKSRFQVSICSFDNPHGMQHNRGSTILLTVQVLTVSYHANNACRRHANLTAARHPVLPTSPQNNQTQANRGIKPESGLDIQCDLFSQHCHREHFIAVGVCELQSGRYSTYHPT